MKVRKRPVEVEAFEWDGTAAGAVPIIGWARNHGGVISYCEDEGVGVLVIQTLEGDLIARAGYWIIKGVEGEFYGCEPEIFTKTYEWRHSLLRDDT